VLLTAIGTDQKNPGASGRHKLPNVGNIRHDDSPDDGEQILCAESKRVYQAAETDANARALSRQLSAIARLALILPDLRHPRTPGALGNVLFHSRAFEGESAPQVERHALVDAAFAQP
jgi:hypothetical protein